jgi:hypothetical protein
LKAPKYHASFPEEFVGVGDAVDFCREFFAWYNDELRHSGIAHLTPNDRTRTRAPMSRAGTESAQRLTRTVLPSLTTDSSTYVGSFSRLSSRIAASSSAGSRRERSSVVGGVALRGAARRAPRGR